MPFGAAIGAVGAIGGSLISANAASNASDKQVQAQQQALAMLQKILGPIIQQGRDIVGQGQGVLGSVLPTLTGAGTSIIGSALPALTSLLTPGPNQTATLSQLPGFQFAQDWGQKAVQNIGSTLGLGGNTLASGAQYATGLAQQSFGSLASLLQNFLQSGLTTTQNVSNTGQNLINAGLTTQTNAGAALGSGGQSAISSIGNAQAAGILGTGNALASGLGGLGNAGLLLGLSGRFGSGGGGGIYGNTAGGFVDPLGMPGG